MSKKLGASGGTFVNHPTPDDYLENLLPLLILGQHEYNEIMEIRNLLEVLSIEKFIKNSSSLEVENLEKIHEKMIASKNDSKEFLRYDIKFHRIIARGGKNNLLNKILEMLLNMNEHYANVHYENFSFESNVADHEKILNAIKKRDAKKGSEAMTEHLSKKIAKI